MMKRLVFALFLTVNLSVGVAQNAVLIDSLKRELTSATVDTIRVLIMTDISYNYAYFSTDSAMKYGEKATQLAKKINFPKGEAIALKQLGSIYRELGNLPKALNLTNRALSFLEENKILREVAHGKSLLGLIYWDLKDYTKALNFFHQSITIFKQLNLRRSVAFIQNNIGATFRDMDQLDSAKNYLNQSYQTQIQFGLKGINTLRHLATVEDKLGNHRLALNIHQQCLQFNDSTDLRNTSLSYIFMSNSYQKISKLDSAVFYAKKGLELAKKGSYRKRIVEAYNALKEAYKLKGDYKLALENEELMQAARDSLSGTSILAVISQEEESQIAIENNKKEYQNQLKQYFLIAGLAVMFLIGFILYRNNRQKQKANVVLQEKNEEIQTTLSKLKSTQAQLIQSEKLASLGELTAGIAHEIQNPLNFVNNFSEVSSELVDEMNQELDKGDINEAKVISDDLKQNLEKITLHGKRASSIVKGMLEHSRTSTGEKELTDINALADEYLRLAYHGLMAKDNSFESDFKTDFDENLPKAEVIPQDIGRVLLNLINNAFYATKDVKNPLVEIKTERLENSVIVTVKDNGKGMTEEVKSKIFQPFFTTKPTGEGTGLGLSLAYDIITKGHGGTIECESVEGEGTTFIVKIYINKN